MLLGGQLSFAESSRALKDEEYAQAKSRGFTLEAVPVAIDGIAVYVNPRLLQQGVKGFDPGSSTGHFYRQNSQLASSRWTKSRHHAV